MSDLLTFALIGLGAGTLIAGLALGVVLNYRGCGAVNLGLGAVAMVSSYIFYGLRTDGDLLLPPIGGLRALDLGDPWDTTPALLFTLALCGIGGALFDLLVFRRLRAAPAISKLIATLGLLVVIQSLVALRFGATGMAAASVLPDAPDEVVFLFDNPIPLNRFALGAILAVVTALLIAVYRWTRFGLATRAAAENERAAILAGHSPTRLSLINTTAAFVLAGGVGMLVAPVTQLDPNTLTLAIVPALAAALIAGFSSFGVAAMAGMCLGILESIIVYLQTQSWFPVSGGAPVQGISDLLILLVIIVTMALRGSALPERGALVNERLPRAPAPVRVGRPALLMSIVVVLTLVFATGARQATITSLIGFVACLPFVVLVGYVGQLSVAQLAFAGIAGFVTSRMADHLGVGFPIGPLVGIATATVLGTLLAIPALRVRGVNLAIVTMAAAVAIVEFGFNNAAWGARLGGDSVQSPRLFGFDLGTNAPFPIGPNTLPSPVFGFLCLVVALGLGLLVANLRRSHLGRSMLAVRSNERAAAAAGFSVRKIKLTAFALSAALAAFAGVLYAYNFGSVSSVRYELISGLSFLAFAYIAGIGSVSGAVLAGVMALEGVGAHAMSFVMPVSSQWQLVFGGLGLIFIVAQHPDGIINSPGAKAPPPFNWIYASLRGLLRHWRASKRLADSAIP